MYTSIRLSISKKRKTAVYSLRGVQVRKVKKDMLERYGKEMISNLLRIFTLTDRLAREAACKMYYWKTV